MKISKIECFPLRTSLERAIGFSQWYYTAKNNFLLKITCDDGTVGWGECYGPNMAIATAVEQHFKPILIGRNPMQNEVLWNLMWRAYHDFNRHGVFMAAISGIDIALWDIKGKKLDTPVRTLLGGSDDPIPCYATGMYYRNDKNESDMLDELLDEAEGYLSQGFEFLKIKLGKNMTFDREQVRRFRERFPNTQIAADSNHAYSYKEALQMGKLLEELDYAWFEEPLAPDNYGDMARLREALTVPIAAGECEQTRLGFARLAEARSLDIFQPDLAYCGGITEFQKINAIASAAHADLVPHCWGLKVNLAVAASAISCVPENPGRFERRKVFLEADRTEHPVKVAIFHEGHDIRDGFFHFNDLPGLGVVVDEIAMQEFMVDLSPELEPRFVEVE